MKRYNLTVSLLAILLSFVSLAYPEEARGDVKARVAIIDAKSSIDLSLKGKYSITSLDNGKVLRQGPYLSAKITASKDGLIFGGKPIGSSAVKVMTLRDSNIYVDSRRFRGDINIIAKDGGKILVINNLGLEEYLYGVLHHEVSHRWPAECIKAQAIVARTFAMQQIRNSKAQPYDLRSDIYSQVYGGRTGEKWSTMHAVDSTRGKVLSFRGDIFPSYYHATCSGHTEDASKLWKIDIAPLKGSQCNFCGHSKHYRWAKEIPLSQVKTKLTGAGYKIGNISSVNALSRNRSGRNDKIEIKDDAGVSVVLSGKDFRQILGPNEIRSTKFDVKIQGSNLAVTGMGWGHGVGMCQWGAYGMSMRGKKCDEILKYYYPGAEITTIDKIKL